MTRPIKPGIGYVPTRLAAILLTAGAVSGGIAGWALRGLTVEQGPLPTPPASTVTVTATPTPFPLLDCPQEDSCSLPELDYHDHGWYANGVRVTK